jgi:hypothetical protein
MSERHTSILRQIESLGYATSVHRMGDYVELHAVRPPDGDDLKIARAEGDGDDVVYRAVYALAAMCGVVLEGYLFTSQPAGLLTSVSGPAPARPFNTIHRNRCVPFRCLRLPCLP